MIELDSRLSNSIMIYFIVCFSIYSCRPLVMFDDKGKFKEFGLTEDKTIYPFWLVVSILGFFIHYSNLLLTTKYV
jgi:hypothetical protein